MSGENQLVVESMPYEDFLCVGYELKDAQDLVRLQADDEAQKVLCDFVYQTTGLRYVSNAIKAHSIE